LDPGPRHSLRQALTPAENSRVEIALVPSVQQVASGPSHPMILRLALTALFVVGTLASAGPRRVCVVTWASGADQSAEQRALIAQVDRRLRDECGDGIEVKPSLEVFPRALKLNLVVLRDRRLLGTISTKAAGSSREAQLRAVVTRVCHEADQLQ
jgi:hypothetical protein